MCPIDFPCEDLGTVPTGGGQLGALPLDELGEVTLGRDELHRVELVLDPLEAVGPARQQAGAEGEDQHSEDGAAVATPHQDTAELRETRGK